MTTADIAGLFETTPRSRGLLDCARWPHNMSKRRYVSSAPASVHKFVDPLPDVFLRRVAFSALGRGTGGRVGPNPGEFISTGKLSECVRPESEGSCVWQSRMSKSRLRFRSSWDRRRKRCRCSSRTASRFSNCRKAPSFWRPLRPASTKSVACGTHWLFNRTQSSHRSRCSSTACLC